MNRTRRNFLKTAGLGSLALVAGAGQAFAAAESRKPNVVVFLRVHP